MTEKDAYKKITKEIKQFCFDLIETMDNASNGVGLSAVQIGKLLRIFVIRPVIEDENNEAKLGEVEVYINPKLSNPSNSPINDFGD